MHQADTLGGPVWVFLVVMLVLAWALGLFVAFDALRSRRAGRFAEIWEPRWFYAVPQAAFVVFSAVTQILGDRTMGAVMAAALPVALFQQFAYLLRVVFPRPPAGPPDG